MGSIKIYNIKKGDRFYENDLHTSIEMIALEDVKLVPIGNGFDGEKYEAKVLCADGETHISVNKEFVDTHYHLKLSTSPEHINIQPVSQNSV